MSKRKSKRTYDENRIHEKAVKIRKMTDEQLVNYIEDRVEKARSEGYNKGKAAAAKPVRTGVREFLEKIRNTKVQGIGTSTLSKLEKAAEENGYIQ